MTNLWHRRHPPPVGVYLIKHPFEARTKENQLKQAPDTRTIRWLPTALTAPPARPRAMPVQEIVLWTPGRVMAALARSIAEVFGKPVRELRDEA